MMETGWEIGFGMELGMEMKSPLVPPPATLFAAVTPPCMYGIPSAESLRVDDLLDFTNHDLFPSSSSSSSSIPADVAGHLLPTQEFSSSAAAGFDASFPDDIYIPSEEAAELEWLSNFVEDSFSETPYHYSLAGQNTPSEKSNFHGAEISVAGYAARGKISHEVSASSSSSSSSSCSSDFPKGKASASSRKKQGSSDGGVRRCTHCASEKTPQWRTGPLGPKTLCNACGVRFKSGRLVPEYRPAASPTFVLTQHSNSHRKVIELRRQKEFLILRHSTTGASAADSGSGGGGSASYAQELLFHDYEVY